MYSLYANVHCAAACLSRKSRNVGTSLSRHVAGDVKVKCGGVCACVCARAGYILKNMFMQEMCILLTDSMSVFKG